MRAGRVKVNGEVCRKLGTKVDPDSDRVEFDDELVTLDDHHTYLLVNKPTGYVTTLDDPKGRRTVVDLLPDDTPRIWPVGRLDRDSEGLLVMTDDGKLTNLITHPSHEIAKTYRVCVAGLVQDDSEAARRLREGVELDDGYTTAPAEVDVDEHTGASTWLEIVLHEGKNRQIRRMARAVGHPVERLRRVAVGDVRLGDLEPGDHRPMTRGEVTGLYRLADADMPPRAFPDPGDTDDEELPKHRARIRDLFD